MIYELSLVIKSNSREDDLSKIREMVQAALGNGQILLEDDWGVRTLAWPTAKGVTQGRYLYFIYSNGDNKELIRNFHIREDIVKYMILKLGDDSKQESILKNYKTPFSTKHKGSAVDNLGEDFENERKKMMKRRVCWLTARQITPDWKDPATYAWAVNEFGKIMPARVTSVSSKVQRKLTTIIKQAKEMGLLSYISRDTLK